VAAGASVASARRTKETIAHAATRLRELPLRPQLSVPSGIRARFVAPAITGFGAVALAGFYAALNRVLPRKICIREATPLRVRCLPSWPLYALRRSC
jgi:hypothetical protein